MKIGLVSPYDWSYPGGVRTHVRHLAREFSRMGHEVAILAPASGVQGPLIERNVYAMGGAIPVPFNGSIARIALRPLLVGRVRRVLLRERFDVLHVHEPLIPGLPLAALHASDVPVVGTFHAAARLGPTSTPALAYTCARPFLLPSFRRLAGRIAVSPAASRFVAHFFDGDYRLIPNGIDLEEFTPSVVPWPAYMDGQQNILFVGRLEKRKGARSLLDAIPAIRERFPQTRFLFVGEGPLRAGLERLAEREGWRDVIFPGYVTDEELPRYFASAHVFCAPALGGESQGIVLLEAMACGVPVVATAIEGYRTVMQDGANGLLAAPGESASLAASLGRLLEDEPLRQRLRAAGLHTARAYAWPDIARRVLEYYCEILGGGSAAWYPPVSPCGTLPAEKPGM